MFNHILLAIDGSELSKITIQKGIEFAESLNAKITGLFVMPEFHSFFSYQPQISGELEEKFATSSIAEAKKHLNVLEETAKAKGISCKAIYARNDRPYEAIIQKAKEEKCDVIIMGSHGRSLLSSALIGSQTLKVLTGSKIPVLVYR